MYESDERNDAAFSRAYNLGVIEGIRQILNGQMMFLVRLAADTWLAEHPNDPNAPSVKAAIERLK